MGRFKVKKIVNLDDLVVGDEIPESDYASLSEQGKFVQFEYLENKDDDKDQYEVEPGTWAIQNTPSGFKLKVTSFVNDQILKELNTTKEFSEKIHKFFSRIHIYKKHGIEVPKRNMLFFGKAGTGKSVLISESLKEFSDGKTAIILWHTDKFEAYAVKDFIQTFSYKGVEKLILIAEDIGGVEMENVKVKSDSSLLSLLDNNEKTFRIPTLIIATTNHPEIFLGNLTNRPGRFDDKFEVGFPTEQARVALYNFYAKDEVQPEVAQLIKDNKFKEFTPAHIKELVIRADIYEKTHKEVLHDMYEEIQYYKKEFTKRGANMGIMSFDE